MELPARAEGLSHQVLVVLTLAGQCKYLVVSFKKRGPLSCRLNTAVHVLLDRSVTTANSAQSPGQEKKHFFQSQKVVGARAALSYGHGG